MKFVLGLLALAALLLASDPAPVAAPELLAVKKVYLLPMRSGFDQYLANEITSRGVLHVVTNPREADAVLTDRLGQAFEERLSGLTQEPEHPPADASTAAPPEKPKKAVSLPDAMSSGSVGRSSSSTTTVARGNVFLVACNTKTVLWSDFREARSHQPKDLKRAADQVAGDLKLVLQPKPAAK